MSENAIDEPQLSAGFAARVLELADRRLARRRRLRWSAATAISIVAVLGTTFWIGFGSSPPLRPSRNPQLVAASAPSAPAQSLGDAPDPLSSLFPDAEALARFTAEDVNDGSENADSAARLFDDEE